MVFGNSDLGGMYLFRLGGHVSNRGSEKNEIQKIKSGACKNDSKNQNNGYFGSLGACKGNKWEEMNWLARGQNEGGDVMAGSNSVELHVCPKFKRRGARAQVQKIMRKMSLPVQIVKFDRRWTDRRVHNMKKKMSLPGQIEKLIGNERTGACTSDSIISRS